MQREPVENSVYAGFMRRIITAGAKRAGDDPVALADFLAVVDEAREQAAADAVARCRANGYSWAEIARPLGITRQAAQQRWGKGERPAGARRPGGQPGEIR